MIGIIYAHECVIETLISVYPISSIVMCCWCILISFFFLCNLYARTLMRVRSYKTNRVLQIFFQHIKHSSLRHQHTIITPRECRTIYEKNKKYTDSRRVVGASVFFFYRSNNVSCFRKPQSFKREFKLTKNHLLFC